MEEEMNTDNCLVSIAQQGNQPIGETIFEKHSVLIYFINFIAIDQKDKKYDFDILLYCRMTRTPSVKILLYSLQFILLYSRSFFLLVFLFLAFVRCGGVQQILYGLYVEHIINIIIIITLLKGDCPHEGNQLLGIQLIS
eukprot:TRINITY_DN1771_c0_g3_i3.p2 TRINITY_DN1771_c0_g3~~TRINITY_DN1771_c0_g3_i3.p2  ORF type:complete len:139 (-),score=3.38 TRINITY_DN1771_c0_g3_i3:180-596(-)